MSAPLLTFVAYQLPALALAVWAAASALAPDPAIGRGQRAWTLLTAVTLPAVVGLLALSALLPAPGLRPIGVLLPVLTLAAAASNVVPVRRVGAGARLLHLPILAWNAALFGIGAVRAFQDLTGIDAGDAGTSLVAGHALLQLVVGHESAHTQPVWMHLPLLLPLHSRFTNLNWLTLGGGAVLGTAMLALLATRMPDAWDRAAGFRSLERPAAALTSDRADPRLGFTVPWAERAVSIETRDAWRAGLLGIDGAALVLPLTADAFDDPTRIASLRGEVDFARAADRPVIASVSIPPAARASRTRTSVETALGRTAWLAAEHLAPDWIVLANDPTGAIDASLLDPTTAAEWAETLGRIAAETRRPAPDVRLAVVVGDISPNGQDLFDRLLGDARIDAVALGVEFERETPETFDERLRAWDAWLARPAARGREIWLSIGAAPHLVGGETGQWLAIRTALDFARLHPAVRYALIDQLVDGNAARGVMTADGRTRRAWRELRRPAPR